MRKDFIQQRFRRKNAANKDDEIMLDQQQSNNNKSPSPISNGSNSFLQNNSMDFLTNSTIANMPSATGTTPNITAIQSLSSLINANSHLFNTTAAANTNGIGFRNMSATKNEILDA